MQWGGNALTAPITPGKRMPVIDRNQVDPETRKAAEGMEAMFLNYMMKAMRDTVPKSDMDLENAGTKVYRSMLDQEFADKAARTQGVGLAEQVIAYLQAQGYTEPREHAAPGPHTQVQPSTGGTHEGQSSGK
jgi:flagellar protein FlgJ